MNFSTVLVIQFTFSQFWTIISAQVDTNNTLEYLTAGRKGSTIDKCEIARQLKRANFDGFFRDRWVCMAEKLSNSNTLTLKRHSRYLDSNQSDPCQQYTLGLFQVPNDWCHTEAQEGFSECMRNGCRLDCLKLLDDDISDDIECVKSILKIQGLRPWPQTIVNSCHSEVESGNKWNFTECRRVGKRAKTVTTISLWVAILIVAVTSLIVFALTYFFYKYRRNSHSVLSTDEIKEFKYGRIRGIPSVILSPPETIRFSRLTQEDFSNQPYDSKYEIPSAEFAIDHNCRLGSGAYGVVYKAMCRGRMVAVKTVNPHATKEYFHSLLGEIKILSHIGKHSAIVNMEGAYTKDLQKGTLYVFMEYCGFGSMEKFLRKYRPRYLTMEEISLRSVDDELKFDDADADLSDSELNWLTIKHLLQYAHQIAKGMEFLSTKKVIHGDLAARNILLVDSNTAKISDFGLSRKLYGYVNYIKKKEVPYPGLSYSLEFVDKLENGFRLLRPKHAPVNVYKQVLLKCWEANPNERPSFLELTNYFYQALNNITSNDYTELVETTNRGGSSRRESNE